MDRKILSLTVPNKGAESLRSLLDLGGAGITSLCQALQQTGPVLASPVLRAKTLQPHMGDLASVEDLQDILLGAVYPLHDLRYHYDLAAEDVYKLVTTALGNVDDWPEEYTQKWGELKENVLALLRLDIVAVEAKGRELLSDRANRVLDLRIFSDVRPLFNEARDNIQANVLTNTLCIKYLEGSGGRRRTGYFSLDPADLDALKEQIEKAQQKNRLICEQHARQKIQTLMLAKENGEHPEQKAGK